jgi:hypothetical protein
MQHNILINSFNNGDNENQSIKKVRKTRSDKKQEPDKNKILILLYNMPYFFKNSEKIKLFFEDEKNIKELKLTDDMKYILTTPYMLRRIIRNLKGDDQNHIKKTTTKFKYTNITNLNIIPINK